MKEIIEKLKSGAEQVLPENEFIKKIESGKKLKIKFGMDPTAPDIHLGHAVALSKLRQWQDLGHEIILIIGDFTAQIGDPTGKSKTRPPLSEEEIKQNAKTYFEQVGRILDMEKTSVCYNSEWLAKLTSFDFIKLAGKITLARVIERDDFQKRLKENVSIGLHELFYPLLQGYDSVELKADVELGGTDQTFNLLMGRFLQEQFGQSPQIIMTMPLLEGLDGVQKMSKSLDNYIGLFELANEAYGKLMSISDELMLRYYQLLLGKTKTEIVQMKSDVESQKVHPMNLKKEMASGIISKFWSKKEADESQKQFESLFQKKDYSQAKEVKLISDVQNPIWIVELLKQLGAVKTSSEAKRLIQSGAVSINGESVGDFKAEVEVKDGMIVKVGKHRIYKVSTKDPVHPE